MEARNRLALSFDPMLPKSLLLALLLYIPPILLVAGEVAFSSQLQFELQTPFDEPSFELATQASSYPLPSFSSKVKTRPMTIYRPRSLDILHNARLLSLQRQESAVEQPIWDSIQVEGPDVGDLHTLAQLARMSGNAYALPGQRNWYDVDQVWNNVRIYPFADCLQGINYSSRAFHSVGRNLMDLEDMYFCHLIIQLLCSLLKARRFKDQHRS